MSNRLSGAEALVRMLQAHGVRHVFGLCGDTSLLLYDDHGIAHILTRDERSAGYMADAYARVTGRVGVCEGPSGGGATYILPGVTGQRLRLDLTWSRGAKTPILAEGISHAASCRTGRDRAP